MNGASSSVRSSLPPSKAGPRIYHLVSVFLALLAGCLRTPMEEASPNGPRTRPLSGPDAAGQTQVQADSHPSSSLQADSAAGDQDPVCVIDGAKYVKAAANPANACQSCQPQLSSSSWSNLATMPGCIAGGTAHTCAVWAGAAWCWGANNGGQLGDGSLADSSIPTQVHGLSSRVSAVAAGATYTCAIADESTFCWGTNATGELGNGSTKDSNIPTPVLNIKRAQTIVAGQIHTCALSDSTVWCWGVNGSGQLGSEVGYYSPGPVQVKNLSSGVTMLAAGDSHTCAATGSEVWCWGDNTFGQLGHNLADSASTSLNPVRVDGLSGNIAGLAASRFETCALTDIGIQCWGTQTGIDASTSPATAISFLTFPSNVLFISGRVFHICGILLGSGNVMCAGDDAFGDLGDGSTMSSPIPVSVGGGLSAVVAVAAGDYHTCAVTPGGTWCWGQNSNGELGDGTTKDSDVPVAVVGLP